MPQQTKDLQYFKDEVAREYNSPDYDHCFDIGARIAKLISPEQFFSMAAERYASYREQQAKFHAWNEGYAMGSARESSKHTAQNPYREKGGGR